MEHRVAHVTAFGNAPGADHLDVVVHQRARGTRIAQFDQVGQPGVNVENVLRQLRRRGDVAARPGHVLKRYELHDQHAVVRRFGDREVEIARQAREDIEIAHDGFRISEQLAQFGDIVGGRVLGREFGAQSFDRALRVHDLGGGDAGEVELHGECLGEQTRVALRYARAAAFAHADFDDAQRLQRSQRVARDDAAGLEAGGEVLFGAEEIAGFELLGKERVAHPGDDLRRQRGRTAGKHDAGGEFAAHRHRLPQSTGLGRAWHVRASGQRQ